MKNTDARRFIIVLCIIASIMVTCACNRSLPLFQTTDKGITSGETEYRFLPEGWRFNGKFTHSFCRDEKGAVYSADVTEMFLHKPKGLFADMDYRPLVRSDFHLPDIHGETSIVVFRPKKEQETYTFSNDEKRDLLLLLDQLGSDPSSAVNKPVDKTAYLGYIHFGFSNIEGLTYGEGMYSFVKLGDKIYLRDEYDRDMIVVDENTSLFAFLAAKQN